MLPVELFQLTDAIVMSITWVLGTITHAITAAGATGSLAF